MKSYTSRRNLIKSSLLGSTLAMLGTGAPAVCTAQTGPLSSQRLGSNLWLIQGAGSNVLVKKAGNGELLVVDGGLEERAEELLETISSSSGSENFGILFNTHWHRQQTGLNHALGAAGVTIFAHENTRLWLQAEIERPWESITFDPLPEAALPNKTFYHWGDIQHDDIAINYGYMLQAHTDGDMFVYLPEDNVLHAGGVVSNAGYPLIDWWTGGWIGGLVDGLETLLRMCDEETVIVPANGPVMSTAELLEMRDMYADIFNQIRSLFMSAKGPQETLDAKPTAAYDARWGESDQFVLLAHQSVLAHFAPDA